MTTIVITGGGDGTTHIHSSTAGLSPMLTFGQATVKLFFTGGGMGGSRKANLEIKHPSQTSIETKSLFKYDAAGNETLVANSWDNETNTGSSPITHTCDKVATDNAGYTFQAKVVLKVFCSDQNYSNPVSGAT